MPEKNESYLFSLSADSLLKISLSCCIAVCHNPQHIFSYPYDYRPHCSSHKDDRYYEASARRNHIQEHSPHKSGCFL